MTRAITACLFLALVAGCAGAGAGAPAATRGATATAREAGTKDCGRFHQSDPVHPAISEAGLDCFVPAVIAHQRARLVATTLSTEGDPITTTYESRSDGQVRVTTDSSQDRFAGGVTLTAQTCRGPQRTKGSLMFASCTQEVRATGTNTTSGGP